jgi:hypothetical protein
MTGLLVRVLDKYGPLAVALVVLAYLLLHTEERADREAAWLMNNLGQDIADLKEKCSTHP